MAQQSTQKPPPSPAAVSEWIERYRAEQKRVIDSIPADAVARLIDRLRSALAEGRQVFVFGNGGSAANASHFITDLGKGASDKVGRRFRCLSLNDNVSWLTALGNDYAYEDVFAGQLQNYARPGDFVLAMSVSGSSPNVVKAVRGPRTTASTRPPSSAASAGHWRNWPTKSSSSTPTTTAGSKTRTWPSATCSATSSSRCRRSRGSRSFFHHGIHHGEHGEHGGEKRVVGSK